MAPITIPCILQVEDDENDVVFMEMALRAVGLGGCVLVAEDGQVAIDYLSGAGMFSQRTRFPLPALIFLDLKLPKVMGLEVLKWIRAQTAFDSTVVIILTASQQRCDIQQACTLRANSFLVKPSNPLALEQMMQSMKNYWLQYNQPTVTTIAAANASPAR